MADKNNQGKNALLLSAIQLGGGAQFVLKTGEDEAFLLEIPANDKEPLTAIHDTTGFTLNEEQDSGLTRALDKEQTEQFLAGIANLNIALNQGKQTTSELDIEPTKAATMMHDIILKAKENRR